MKTEWTILDIPVRSRYRDVELKGTIRLATGMFLIVEMETILGPQHIIRVIDGHDFEMLQLESELPHNVCSAIKGDMQKMYRCVMDTLSNRHAIARAVYSHKNRFDDMEEQLFGLRTSLHAPDVNCLRRSAIRSEIQCMELQLSDEKKSFFQNTVQHADMLKFDSLVRIADSCDHMTEKYFGALCREEPDCALDALDKIAQFTTDRHGKCIVDYGRKSYDYLKRMLNLDQSESMTLAALLYMYANSDSGRFEFDSRDIIPFLSTYNDMSHYDDMSVETLALEGFIRWCDDEQRMCTIPDEAIYALMNDMHPDDVKLEMREQHAFDAMRYKIIHSKGVLAFPGSLKRRLESGFTVPDRKICSENRKND